MGGQVKDDFLVILTGVKKQLAVLRALEYALEQQDPNEFTKEEMAQVGEYIKKHDKHGLKRYLSKHDLRNLEDKPMYILKEVARGLFIPYWSRLTKPALINAIKEYQVCAKK